MTSTQNQGRLAGRVALITGVGGGQGRVAARRFAEEGAVVVGADIKTEGFAATQRQVEVAGGTMTGNGSLDLTDDAAVRTWVDDAADRHGGIDIVYNNAGAFALGGIATLTPGQWRWSIDRELNQVFTVTHAAWPHLVARGGGVVLNVGSTAGLISLNGGSGIAHSAAKAAVIGMTRDLADEGGPHGIRAVCISPGSVESESTAAFFADPAIRRQLLEPQIVKRLGRPEDIVEAALYLVSDAASFITGTNIVIDGGYTAR
ncbi:short-chain dehydrogenase [Amycolatopsis deserti]|uniref:Short-chain dehydrogenase n=1 Tax=Amycolatopsis deserti TaxID=185696 RepID=A0ABQ3IGJ3_9PSEU|nr:SDR family NAD(P)-dependent oxidoreductase [Amycolatopsis deserti]GHE80494.1 short-chain dehydrogenase [Amycolatopsis deserti]